MFIDNSITEKIAKLHNRFNDKKLVKNVINSDINDILKEMSVIVEELCRIYNKHFKDSIKIIKEYKPENYIEYINVIYNLLKESSLNEKNLLMAFNILIKGYIWEFNENVDNNIAKNYFKMLKYIFFELLEVCKYPVSFNRNPDRIVQNIATIKSLGRYYITSDEDFILPQLQIPLIRQTIDRYLYEIYQISQLVAYNPDEGCLEKYRVDFKHSKRIYKLIFNEEEIRVLDKMYSWSCRFIHAGYKEKRWFIELCSRVLELIYHNHHELSNNRIEIFNKFNELKENKKKIIVNFGFSFSFEYYSFVKSKGASKFIKSLETKYLQKIESIVNDYFNDIDYNSIDNDTIEIMKIMQQVLLTLCVLVYNMNYFKKAGYTIEDSVDKDLLNNINSISDELDSDNVNIQKIETILQKINKMYNKLFKKMQ